MYLLLLLFGGLLGAAGVVLAATGISLRDGIFDAALLTPGIVAAVGGLLLIGLGAGLRTLQRIERNLASRPMPRALATVESGKTFETAETPREPMRIPFAPRLPKEGQGSVVAREPGALDAKVLDTAPPTDKASPPAIGMPAVHDASAESGAQHAGKGGNGAAGIRSGFRLPANLRSTGARDRQSEPALDALWPKGPRAARALETGPIAQIASATSIQSPQSVEASNWSAAQVNLSVPPSAVSILKSGVVNDMPYTLYSDGSIEAQLPEGTLRFGSITELRNHIGQSA